MSSKIEQIRNIVESRTMGEVEGQSLDFFSASAIIQVYDRISPESKKEFEKRSVAVMAELALEVIRSHAQ